MNKQFSSDKLHPILRERGIWMPDPTLVTDETIRTVTTGLAAAMREVVEKNYNTTMKGKKGHA